MRMLLITLAVAALGCGEEKTDKAAECRKVAENSKFGAQQIAKDGGPSAEEIKTKLYDVCMKSDEMAKCDALKDETKINECLAKVLGVK